MLMLKEQNKIAIDSNSGFAFIYFESLAESKLF